MNNYRYQPQSVCSKDIQFGLEDGKLHNVKFFGGCHGNLQAIGKLVEGKDAREIVALLKGNDCAGRGTSCADQLALAVEAALQREETA